METHRFVKIWLFIGLVMLFVQVIVGGITRITGSGLSITKWEIVTGTLPPMSEKAWDEEFNLYKDTPQYKEINEGMEMGSIFQSGSFKFIYFWEWVHRLWARTMGFVFLFPLIYFLIKGWVQKPLLKRLGVVFLLAGLAASFGWIMVASGLVERPWVNAYKLSLHLCIAFAVYSYLLWTYFLTKIPRSGLDNIVERSRFRKIALIFTYILWIQIFFGGIMSGMKAGVIFPTWPDMNGELIPQIVFNSEEWSVYNFNYYDRNLFMPALIHLIHRSLAYLLFFTGIYMVYKIIKSRPKPVVNKGAFVLVTLLIIQVLLGILTVINCQGSIPLFYGVMHQAVALCLLTASLYMNYRFQS
ncbi:MAG: COX15/CtaA family protein [Saprospiraceae bacterium]|nr:COX15/CtaA family protein [Saprospiraceae bacterium]